jgi:hypothetical protein
MRLAPSNGIHRVGAPLFHLRTETDPVSDILCLLEYRTLGKVQLSVITNVTHHRQNPLQSTNSLLNAVPISVIHFIFFY